MRLTRIIFFIALATPVCVKGQENFLKKPLSLELRNATIEDALLAISDQGGFNFSYNADIVHPDSLITLSLHHATVKQALDEIFRKRAEYRVTGSYLVIQTRQKYAPPAQRQEYSITGYVLNHLTGEKLPYASVYDVDNLTSSMTNGDGYFNLTVSSDRERIGLAVAKENFLDTVLIVQPKSDPITIYIKPKIDMGFQPVGIDVETPAAPPKIEELKIVQKLVTEEQRKQARNIDIFRTMPVQISVIPSVSINSLNSSAANHFSLNIFGGYSKALKGVEIGGLFNILREDMTGVELAGLANFVGGETKGAQISGLYNHAIGSARGLQLAGIVNINHETLEGVQVAGIANHVTKDVAGWQIAGIGNDAWGAVDGLQIGGVYNFTRMDVNQFQIGGVVNHSRNANGFQIGGVLNNAKDVKGFQIAGLANHAKTVNGFQIAGLTNAARDSVGGFQVGGIANFAQTAPGGQFAGLLNIALKEVKGFQLAGIVNYAGKAHSQIGLLNISDSVSGVPVGLLSFVRQGYHSIEASFSDAYAANFAFRTGVKRFYNIITGGAKLHRPQSLLIAGYGIGTSFGSGAVGFAIEGVQHAAFEKEGEDSGVSHLSQIGFYARFGERKRFTVTTGPTFNVLASGWKDVETGDFLTDIAPYSLFEKQNSARLVKGWIGFRIGMEFQL